MIKESLKSILVKGGTNHKLYLLFHCRVLRWPSSWVQRLILNAQPSPQRKASTACFAPQPWPASTNCRRSPSPAPPAASPKDSCTCPAGQIYSPPPSRRRRPRAVRSCERGEREDPLGCSSHMWLPIPSPLVLGKGGWAWWFYQDHLLNPSLTPPGNQTTLRRGGCLAVHLLLNFPSFPFAHNAFEHNRISRGLTMKLSFNFSHLYSVCSYDDVPSVWLHSL